MQWYLFIDQIEYLFVKKVRQPFPFTPLTYSTFAVAIASASNSLAVYVYNSDSQLNV